MSITDKYNEIKDPNNLVRQFKDIQEFREWANMGTVEDLLCAIQEFYKCGLNEHCIIILDVCKDKINSYQDRRVSDCQTHFGSIFDGLKEIIK